jgi:hypothetical protein
MRLVVFFNEVEAFGFGLEVCGVMERIFFCLSNNC